MADAELSQEDISSLKQTRGRLELRPFTVIVVSIIAAATLAALGSLSDISLGDECVHIRHVRAYAQAGRRVPYDTLFSHVRQKALPFSGTPLWHTGLAVLWAVTGTESQTLAQFYHAGFYLLLVLCVYFLARIIWGNSAGSWAWLLVATMPMVCAYSILMYTDVPATAVSALALLLLWRKNFLWCGIVLGAAYFTKMNMLSFAPWAVIFAAWWAGGTWKRRLMSAAMVAVPVAAVFGYDMFWRFATYGNMMGQRVLNISDMPELVSSVFRSKPSDYTLWKPLPITQPMALVKQTGLGLLAGAVLALFRAWDVRSRWLWACFLVTAAGFVWIFVPTGCMQMRYTFPIVLVVILLSGRVLGGLRLPAWLKIIIVAGLIFQAAAASGYVWHKRRIPKWDRAGYEWIRRNTPEDARIMYPERILATQTGRPFMWSLLNPAYLMTEATDRQRVAVLDYFRVSYIAVPLRRRYDRHKEGNHAGGYPYDFVGKMRTAPYLTKVYENPGFVIFKFTPSAHEGQPQALLWPAKSSIGARFTVLNPALCVLSEHYYPERAQAL